uniref:Pep3/Vps18 beta-propeller domain-containing protein n=1 Tax=Lotharella globosa TaxID=91324 RepID=A0A7S3Z7D3_9EUKA|mmetsp:Transcript_31755/g.61458  ORF Transcript_31755/g.61458 Transcript_31755/m.61458 type:complete len:1022 (+) Transcript_31755:24-3089(+)
MSDSDAELDEDIFTIERLEWKLDKRYGRIASLSAGNNTLLMGTDMGWVIRFTVVDDRKVRIELPSHGRENIHRVFLDPTGTHGLVSTVEGTTYYIVPGSKRMVQLKGLRGVVIESVAWNKHSVIAASSKSSRGLSATDSTGSVLLGTRKGSIYEVIVEEGKEKFSKRLWEIDDGPMPICGLQMDVFPTDNTKFFVMAATPTRHYQFIGGPTYEALFSRYVGGRYRGFQELPGRLSYSELHFSYNEYPNGNAQRCAWLTQAGIFQGDLVFGAQSPGDKVCDQHDLVNYPPTAGLDGKVGVSGGFVAVPLSIAMSQFHYLLLFKGQFICTNRLSREVVYDISLKTDAKRYGAFRGLGCDLSQGTFWMFSEHCVFEVLIVNEDRDVWRLLLEKGDFDGALRHCKESKPKLDMVRSKQADKLFSQGYYKEAARVYAQTTRTFEEITLQFVTAGKPRALKTYLLLKLGSLPATAETQLTMVSTWVTEIYLSELADLDGPPPESWDTSGDEKEREAAARRAAEERAGERKRVSADFRRFLEDHYDILDQATTFNIISSHGRTAELTHYAEVIGDRDWLVRHSLSRGKAKMALLILAKYWTRHSTGKRKKAAFDSDLYYRYAPALLTHSERIAKEMVTTLIRIDKKLLDPARLIPAFVRYDAARKLRQREMKDKKDSAEDGGRGVINEAPHQGIRYFSNVVDSTDMKDPAVHNYLVSLLVEHPRDDPLIKFVERWGHEPVYEYKLALAMCHRHNKMRAASEIHKVVGEYEEAIKVALTINLQLAQLIAIEAEKAGVDEERSKKLWLLVARHVIEVEKHDVEMATRKVSDILKHCSLRIDEVLPFFPDFVKIGSFKGEVVRSLEQYNQKIRSLKEEMDEHTKTAQRIRADIEAQRNRTAVVSETRRCDLSGEQVTARPMTAFPCGHVFLTDKLVSNVIKFAQKKPRALLSGPFAAVTTKEEKLRRALDSLAKDAQERGTANLALVNLTRADWARIASHECPLCGSMMILTCHDPLIGPDEAKEADSWAI